MGNDLRQVALSDICTIYDGPHATPKKTDTGPIFLGISSLQNGRLDLTQSERLSEEDYGRWTKRVVPSEGDIVFSYETRLGEVAIIPKGLRACLGRRMGLLRPDRARVDPKYLLYCYQGPDFQETIRRRTIHGSTVDRIPLIEMPNFPISIPPIPKQQAVAHILGTLDDKIELLRSMNETLEAMARALFKSWFIDFDPVRKKAEGQPTGLPPEIDALFPDSFEDSELGKIPKGWSVKELTEEFQITMGQSPPGESYNETGEGIAFYQGRTDFGFRYPTRRLYCTDPRRVAEAGDTLVSVRAPVGDMNMANEKCCIGRGVSSVRHRSSLRSFTYYCLNSLRESFYTFEAEGTVFGSINQNDFYKIKCVFGSQEIARFFDVLTCPMDDEILSHSCEISLLEKERDSLLPRLISGDLELSDDMISKILEPAK